jgi:hypothetical protein
MMDFPGRPGETTPEHIGDGVYVSSDGYHIWLRTTRENGWHEIALDETVFSELVEYASRVKSAAMQAEPCN